MTTKYSSASSFPGRFILYPAALSAPQNHRRLIDALSLTRRVQEAALVLTGPTLKGRGSLLDPPAARGVENHVRHLGYVSSRQLAALYRRAEALVFPSLYEGFGAPPLEAMASGCPVATSGETSLEEVCGSAAVSFDALAAESIASAIDVLLRDAVCGRGCVSAVLPGRASSPGRRPPSGTSPRISAPVAFVP